MSNSKNVFIVGPGFIGWNVLDLLIAEGYEVSALVRRKEHAEGITKSGAQAILGDLNDHDLIVKHAFENHVSHVLSVSGLFHFRVSLLNVLPTSIGDLTISYSDMESTDRVRSRFTPPRQTICHLFKQFLHGIKQRASNGKPSYIHSHIWD